MTEKNRLRKTFLEKRRQFPDREIKNKSSQIRAKLLQRVTPNSTVFCYVAFRNEVSTTAFLEELLKRPVRVTVPVTRGAKMEAAEIEGFHDLKEAENGIREPVSAETVPRDKIDLAVVPGIAFDHDGNRIGYGEGYYDRFLSDFTGYTIGVTYSDFLRDELPTDTWDIPVDAVLTENQTVETHSGQDVQAPRSKTRSDRS